MHELGTEAKFDLIITNAQVVRPSLDRTDLGIDIGVSAGRIAALEPGLAQSAQGPVVDAKGSFIFPGVVDAHTHMGIYAPLAEDAVSESRAAAFGGTTTVINYMRTGQYYLNQGGSYGEFFPQVLDQISGNSHVDYAFHLAPMQASHIEEIPRLIEEYGVTSFKIFMFYGSHGLHGRSSDQAEFLMTPPGERYDYAHFEFVMRGIARAREQFPQLADHISLSLHCETAEIMAAYTKLVEEAGELTGLAAYSASRPPHSEGLAVTIASYLAHETDCSNINLLHLSGAKAMDAALRMERAFPAVNFRREVTIGHLLADIDTANGVYGKVNPPLRPREDVEALWNHVLAGEVDWVVSDHACCKLEHKVAAENPDDVWLAKSGFGGTEYLLSGLFSEGTRRGLSPAAIARLVSTQPAQRYGCTNKGDLEVGFDADLVALDPKHSYTVAAADSPSTQGYTPFEGMELTGRVTDVWLRGSQILENGQVVGTREGRYLPRGNR